MTDQAVVQCQEIIEYQFHEPDLLALALTHASLAATRLDSNERLEFLGDAVLGLVVCEALYLQNEDLLEGDMTKVKSSVVSRRTCAEIVRGLGLVETLMLGGEMADPSRVPESVAAAVFESIIGAVYLDGGLDAARTFILRHVQPHIDDCLTTDHQKNFKSMLQQHAQRISSAVPEYRLLDEQGPDHSKCFEICVCIDGTHYPSAWGPNKKAAEQAAARRALEEMGLLNEAADSPETEPEQSFDADQPHEMYDPDED
jgi:ribonuclease III